MTQQLKTAELQGVLDEITPVLDEVLDHGPLNAHQHMGPFHELPRELKRRGGICNATSWLLSDVLKKHDIRTAPYAKMETIQVGDTHYMTYHVILKMLMGDTRYIDPTSQQFYRYVGLTSDLAHENTDVAELYPENHIAIIDSESTEFQDQFADNAHRIEQQLGRIGIGDGILTGTTLMEKKHAYREVWNTSTYKPMFPPNREMRQAVFESAKLLDMYTLL